MSTDLSYPCRLSNEKDRQCWYKCRGLNNTVHCIGYQACGCNPFYRSISVHKRAANPCSQFKMRNRSSLFQWSRKIPTTNKLIYYFADTKSNDLNPSLSAISHFNNLILAAIKRYVPSQQHLQPADTFFYVFFGAEKYLQWISHIYILFCIQISFIPNRDVFLLLF